MERQNNPQQTIAKSLASEADTVAKTEQKLADSYFLRELIQRYPRLVLLGVSTFLFLTIYFSIVSILQIGVMPEEPKSIPISTTNPNNAPTSSDNSLPLWLLGAVTLGSVVGGVAIAKRLSNSSTQLAQFFLQFQSSHYSQQFPPSRQSILSLPALKLSEPKPTWADSFIEESFKIHPEADEFIILIEDTDDGKENFLETQELTPEEKTLIFENIVFSQNLERSPVENISNSEILLTSAIENLENDAYPADSKDLAKRLDLRQKISLATLLDMK